MNQIILKCITCKKEFSSGRIIYTCPQCGHIRGTLDVLYDYKKIRKSFNEKLLRASSERTHWRYLHLLPVSKREKIPFLRVGFTPLLRADNLSKELGLKKLFVKDDTVNPSASLKDRASSLCVVKAVEAGAKAIITASTGNAAASLSAFGASAGLKTIILVPCSTQRAKLAQIMVYGANLIAVRATYDCTFDLSVAISLEHGIYLRSTAVNPFCVEGKKTVSFEIWEQMDFNLPDYVIVPAGDGCIISGVYKGFYDLKQSGLTEKIPKIIGVQSEGSAAIAKAFERNLEVPEPVKARTIADSISVDMPRDGVKALRAARESGGFFVTVTDNAILKSIPLMARLTGIFPEPASAASLAGLKKLVEQGRIQQSSTIVLLATGSGLKDTENAIRSSSRTIPEADPDIKSIEKLI